MIAVSEIAVPSEGEFYRQILLVLFDAVRIGAIKLFFQADRPLDIAAGMHHIMPLFSAPDGQTI